MSRDRRGPMPNPNFVPPKLDLLWPSSWQGQPIPQIPWIVPGLLPARSVTMLNALGGAGKTMLELQLLVAAALGREWVGLPVPVCKSLGIFTEDEPAVLHLRVARILAHYGAEFADLEDRLALVSLAGKDATLMSWPRPFEPGNVTELFGQVMRCVLDDHGAQLVVLDPKSRIFSGDMNSQAHSYQFLDALRSIATEADAAVLLSDHVSMSGESDGTMQAGSRAWHNAVRSRLTLKAEGDDGLILEQKKSNYGAKAKPLRLTWKNGVIVPDQDATVATTRTNRLTTREQGLLRDIRNILADPMAPVATITPYADGPAVQGVPRTFVRDRLVKAGVLDVDENGALMPRARSFLSEGLTALRRANELGVDGTHIWIVRS